ncbi:MAG: riboflavin kinase [Candidatus Paceibacterota bacterium]
MEFHGMVIEGSKRARSLGYPTVNIALQDGRVSGVYAALVRIEKTIYRAAAFADPERDILEAYVFGLSEEMYGREVSIELTHKIRDTRTFESDDLLKQAIAADVAAVRDHFDE